MKPLRKYLLLAPALLALQGCENVRSYQMQQLKDPCMETNSAALEKLEAEAETYREGASGGMGGKTGGGCGCN